VSELLGAAIAGAVGLVVLVAFVWWLVAWGRGADADARGHHVRALELAGAVADRDELVTTLTGERDREHAARKTAEEAARRALERLSKSADAADLVDALNDELARLSTLPELSRVPTPAPAAAGRGRTGEGELHGAADGAAGGADSA
jgi:hypothetical protein